MKNGSKEFFFTELSSQCESWRDPYKKRNSVAFLVGEQPVVASFFWSLPLFVATWEEIQDWQCLKTISQVLRHRSLLSTHACAYGTFIYMLWKPDFRVFLAVKSFVIWAGKMHRRKRDYMFFFPKKNLWVCGGVRLEKRFFLAEILLFTCGEAVRSYSCVSCCCWGCCCCGGGAVCLSIVV